MRAAPIGGPGLAAGRDGAAPTRVPRENGAAWRDAGAARRLELLFQFLVFAPQPLALRFRPAQILAQPLILARCSLDDLLRVGGGGSARRARHAPVMPDSLDQSTRGKCGPACADPLNRYVGSWELGVGS